MTTNGDASSLPSTAGELHPAATQRSGLGNIFMGPTGLRPGWRLLLFIFLMFVCIKAAVFTLKHTPGVDAWFKAQDPNVFTPAMAIVSESILLFGLLVSTAVMTLIEKRTYADYYLPPNQFLGKRFWQGVPYGFAMLSLLLILIAAFHGFSLGNVALSSADALKFGALYGHRVPDGGNLRGVLLSRLHAIHAGARDRVLARSVVLSIFFGAIHIGQSRRRLVWRGDGGIVWRYWRRLRCSGPGISGSRLECTPHGIGRRRIFMECRTADFWRRDIFSIPRFHGPTWLTGGKVGPEGSVFRVLGADHRRRRDSFYFPQKVIGVHRRAGLIFTRYSASNERCPLRSERRGTAAAAT